MILIINFLTLKIKTINYINKKDLHSNILTFILFFNLNIPMKLFTCRDSK